MSSQLSASAISKSYGARRVLDSVNLVAGSGERLGLVGENGSGKSTLLRLLAGTEAPDAGEVKVHGSIGFLPQDPVFPAGATVAGVLDSALVEIRALARRLGELEARMAAGAADPAVLRPVLAEYGEVVAAFESRDGWSADARAGEALAGLGLAGLDRGRELVTLSGGERARLVLALLLVRRPDVLLLDEPTNHLDESALGYLEGQLRAAPGLVIAASHDRVFLDAVCTSLLDLEPGPDGLTRYGGAYSAYLEARAAGRLRWEQAYAGWCDEVEALEEQGRTVARRVAHGRPARDNNKMSYDAHGAKVQQTVSRRVRDVEQRLARLRAEPVPKPPAPLRFRAPANGAVVGASGGLLVQVRDLEVTERLTVPALDIAHDTRLLVTGPNGAGKSTLLDVIAGRLVPEHGRILKRRGLRIGLLPQLGRFPDPGRSVLQTFAAGRRGPAEEHAAVLLALGLIHPRDLRSPVGSLSVGQQRRLALARLLADDPELLLLDEPTNHFSLALVEELEDAVDRRPGPVVVVSHDRWLRRRWAGSELGLAAGRTVDRLAS